MVGYSENGGQRRSSRQLGSSVFVPSESGSLFGLRRSLRLRSKPAMTMSVKQSRKRRNSRNPKPKRPLFCWAQPGEIICRGGLKAMARILRNQRTIPNTYFRIAYSDSSPTSDLWDNIVEKRFIMVSGRECAFDAGRSHGIIWIGVYGINSFCAIFLNKKPDMQRIIDRLGHKFLTYFMKYVLSEMEGIANSPPYSDVIGGKPFAVVSIPDYRGDEKSCPEAVEAQRKSVEYLTPSIEAQGEAVEYLKTKMTNHSAFSKHQSQVIAISAIQRLCQKKLHAKEFMLCHLYKTGFNYDCKMKMLSTSKKKRRLSRLESEEGEYVQTIYHQT